MSSSPGECIVDVLLTRSDSFGTLSKGKLWLGSNHDSYESLTFFSVELFGRFDVLSPGICIIDLPGYGDSDNIR